MDLKDRIRERMIELDMRPVDLVNVTKMGSSKISQILNGKVTDPRLSTAKAIAEALGVTIDYLAGMTDEIPKVGEMTVAEVELIGNYRECTRQRQQMLILNSRDCAAMSKEAAECGGGVAGALDPGRDDAEDVGAA